MIKRRVVSFSKKKNKKLKQKESQRKATKKIIAITCILFLIDSNVFFLLLKVLPNKYNKHTFYVKNMYNNQKFREFHVIIFNKCIIDLKRKYNCFKNEKQFAKNASTNAFSIQGLY